MKNVTGIKKRQLVRYECPNCREIMNAEFPLNFKIPEKLVCCFCAADNFIIKHKRK